MNVRFNFTYDTMTSTLMVEQGGAAVSTYSQFSHCSGRPFWEWYQEIPGYCLSEANGAYEVNCVGGVILGLVLKKELSHENGCSHFSYSRELITGIHRMRLANELMGCSHISANTLQVDISGNGNVGKYFSQTKDLIWAENVFRYAGLNNLPLRFRVHNRLDDTAGVLISTNEGDFYQIAASAATRSPKIMIFCREGPLEFLWGKNNCFLFSCCARDVEKLIRTWVSEIVFPKYALGLVEKFKRCRTWGPIDSNRAMKKVDVLLSRTPYLELKVTSRIELNDIGRFELIKYPEDIPCRAFTSDGAVALLGNGGQIKPVGEGSARIIVQVKDHPEIQISEPIKVYKYRAVRQIRLIPSSTTLVVGEKCSVQCSYTPANAHNISQAQWSVIPAGILKPISAGAFLAVKAGKCKIVHRVGSVEESVVVNIAAKPSSVRFQTSTLSIKLGDSSQRLQTMLYPAGCRGGQVKYRVSNPAVLDFNTNNGQIVPKQEGDAVITATLLEKNGIIVDDCNCNVTILPPKDVVTPDGALVLMIISLIGALLLIGTEWRYLCGIGGCVGAIWYALRAKSKQGYMISALLFVVTTVLVCLGGAL